MAVAMLRTVTSTMVRPDVARLGHRQLVSRAPTLHPLLDLGMGDTHARVRLGHCLCVELRPRHCSPLLENEFGAVDCTVSMTVLRTATNTVIGTVAMPVAVTILRMMVMLSIFTVRRLVGGARSALCRAAHAP